MADEVSPRKITGLPGSIEVRVRIRSEDGGYSEEQWVPLEGLEGLQLQLLHNGLRAAKAEIEAEKRLLRAEAKRDSSDGGVE